LKGALWGLLAHHTPRQGDDLPAPTMVVTVVCILKQPPTAASVRRFLTPTTAASHFNIHRYGDPPGQGALCASGFLLLERRGESELSHPSFTRRSSRFSPYAEKNCGSLKHVSLNPLAFPPTITAGVNPRPTAAVKPQRVQEERASCAAWHASFLHCSFRFP